MQPSLYVVAKLDRLIGHHIADEQVTDILRRLGCEVTEGKDEWQAVAPSWRFDMEIGRRSGRRSRACLRLQQHPG